MLSLLLAPLAALTMAAAPCPDSAAARLTAQLTPWLSERAAAGTFSGVVMVACEGRPIYTASYGMADRTNGVPITPATRFNLGSMNKMWTAIAVAQLVEQGKIDLNSPVGRYLPELTNAQVRDQVQVRHLLTHTSGLTSYFKRGFLSGRVAVTSMSDYLRFFIDDSLLFTPGARMQYSNAGFAILGLLIERVSGESFYTYMQREVLDRAGMSRALYPDLRNPQPDYAVGYARAPGGTTETANTGVVEVRGGPAGGAYGTAADVLAFSRALFDHRLVGAATVSDFTSGKIDMGPGTRYGYGFGTAELNGWRSVGHNGGAPGVGAEFLAFPEQGMDVIVLTNIDMPVATQVAQRAARIITGQDMPAGPSTASASPTERAGAAPVNAGQLPDTPAGRRLRSWLAAVEGGLPAYTRFVENEMVPRTDRTPAERAAQTMRFLEPVGPLTFQRVSSSSAEELVIVVQATRGGALFTVTATIEPTAPYRLTLVNFQPNRD